MITSGDYSHTAPGGDYMANFCGDYVNTSQDYGAVPGDYVHVDYRDTA